MSRIMLRALGVMTLLSCPVAAMAQAAPVPQIEIDAAAYAPFERMIGRGWRGTGTAGAGVEDIQRWDWALGGHAVRVVHSVNGGAYAGETLIFRDKDSGDYIFHYFTTGGFHTTGTIRPTEPGGFTIEETVHGAEGIERLRSTSALGPDGVYRVRSSAERDGQWVEAGGFDYREDPSATPVMPTPQHVAEAPASAGPLELTRRIVRGVDEAGADVAGYVRIRNGSTAADQLLRVSCACAERVELHRIQRDGPTPAMAADPSWSVPASDLLEVRPGGDLHFMLIKYDPAQAANGKVRLRLEFEGAGAVEADFALVADSRAAWESFDR